MSPRYKEVYIPSQDAARLIEHQINIVGGSFQRIEEPENNGIPSSVEEKRERKSLHRAATCLFKNNIYDWSIAFDLDNNELLNLEGIGHDALKAIRKFQQAVRIHSETLDRDNKHNVYIVRPSETSAPHGIVIDGIFIPPIFNPGAPERFVSLLRGRQIEEKIDRSKSVLSVINGNIQFLNNNFDLGLQINADVGSEGALFSLIAPERTKIIFPQSKSTIVFVFR